MRRLRRLRRLPTTLHWRPTKLTSKLSLGKTEETEETADYIALETNKTDFKVVTGKDLRSNHFKFQDASSFRDRMLNGGRVRREPHENKTRREEKKRVCGLNSKLKC